MPFVPVPDTLEVEIVFEQAGQVVENTLYFTNASGWDGTSILDWLDAIRVHVETDLLPLLHTSIKLVRLIGTLLDAADAISLTLNVSPPVTGSVNGNALPNETAYAVTLQTAGRGRSKRGRNFIPGIAANMTADSNNVTSDFRVGLLAYFDSIRAEAITNGTPLVVVSRYSGVDADKKPIPRAEGITTPVTSAATFDSVLDSQRRRKPGAGI